MNSNSIEIDNSSIGEAQQRPFARKDSLMIINGTYYRLSSPNHYSPAQWEELSEKVEDFLYENGENNDSHKKFNKFSQLESLAINFEDNTATLTDVKTTKKVIDFSRKTITFKRPKKKEAFRKLKSPDFIDAYDDLKESFECMPPVIESKTRRTKRDIIDTLTNKKEKLQLGDITRALSAYKELHPKSFDFTTLQASRANAKDLDIKNQTGLHFIPLHVGSASSGHFVSLTIDFDNETIYYYDPKGVPLDQRADVEKLAKGLRNKYFKTFFKSAPDIVSDTNNQQKNDNINCGRYVLADILERLDGNHDFYQETIKPSKVVKKMMPFIKSLKPRIAFNLTMNKHDPYAFLAFGNPRKLTWGGVTFQNPYAAYLAEAYKDPSDRKKFGKLDYYSAVQLDQNLQQSDAPRYTGQKLLLMRDPIIHQTLKDHQSKLLKTKKKILYNAQDMELAHHIMDYRQTLRKQS